MIVIAMNAQNAQLAACGPSLGYFGPFRLVGVKLACSLHASTLQNLRYLLVDRSFHSTGS